MIFWREMFAGALGIAVLAAAPARADTFTDLVRNRDLAGLRALMETDAGSATRYIIDVRREYGNRYRTAQVPPLFHLLSSDLNRGTENTTFRREAMRLLIEHGADVNDPVRVSYGEGTVMENFWPIHYSLWPEEIRILAEAGANVNKESYLGDTKLTELSRQVISLNYSSDDQTNDNIRALTRAGADVTAANRQGETPLQLAIAALFRAKKQEPPNPREIVDNEERVEILKQAELERIQRDLEEIRRRTGSGQGAPGSPGDTNERRGALPGESAADPVDIDEETGAETIVTHGH